HPRTQALVQQQLGLLAQAQGDLPLAAGYLAQSIAISQPSGFDSDTARSLCYQALICCQLGQPELARASLQQVVPLLQPAPALLLMALFAAAVLVETTEAGREEEVIGWKTAVFHHPATPHDIRQQIPPTPAPATLPSVSQLLQMILAALEM
ncbi:MAG: tetratricopeptide repeat protein, partial [Anaerolineales bacterium]|nr:tetratricopeptide repeat protein [Anaerolineales bacterium]